MGRTEGCLRSLVSRLLIAAMTLALLAGGSYLQAQTDAARTAVSYAAPGDPAPMPTPRLGIGLAQVGPLLYAIGGSTTSSEDSVTTNEAYDTRTNTWIARAPMPSQRRLLGAAAAPNGRVYAIGGAGPTPSDWESAAVEEYDPSANSWRTRAPMPTPRYALGVVAGSNGKIYAIGGAGSNFRPLSTVEEYDPATNSWASRKSMPTPRRYLAVAAGADGRIYATGGYDENTRVTAAVEAYDPVTDEWTVRTPLPEPRSEHALLGTRDGKLDLLGGTVTHEAPMHLQYDPLTNRWSALNPPNTKRIRFGAVEGIGHRIYLIGGYDTSLSRFAATPEIYDPAADAWFPDRDVPTIASFRINQGAAFTNSLQVTLSIQATDVGEGVDSMSFTNINDGTSWSSWQPYAPAATWMLGQGSDGDHAVYVRVRDRAGNVSRSPVLAVITLDQVPPTGSVRIGAAVSTAAVQTASPTRTIQLSATDNLSSPDQIQMRLSNRPDFAGAHWKPFASSASWDFTGGVTVHAQFKDAAGNLSQTYSASIPGLPPSGASPTPPSCSPRPRIAVSTEKAIGIPEDGGAIWVTVATTGTNNGLRAVRFDSFAGARVTVGSQENQTSPFSVSIPPGQEPTSLRFLVQQQARGTFATVRLVVVDGCGEWSTLVGGGPNAF